jgi:hypothetical protein
MSKSVPSRRPGSRGRTLVNATLSGAFHYGSQFGNGNRGGIRGQDGFGLTFLAEFAEDLLFQGSILEYRLDSEISFSGPGKKALQGRSCRVEKLFSASLAIFGKDHKSMMYCA